MEKKKGLSLQTVLTIAGLALIYLLAFLLDRIPGIPHHAHDGPAQGRNLLPRGGIHEPL